MKNQYFTVTFLLNIHIGLAILTENANKFNKNHHKVINTNINNEAIDAKKAVDDYKYGRIIGGEIVKDNKLYPYHARYGRTCGAVIIDKRWLMTVAHCGKFPYVQAGSVYYNNGSKFFIRRHHIHPIWSKRGKRHPFDYDFQLLELNVDITLGSTLQPIKIGNRNDLAVGDIVTVTGWGSTEHEGPLVDTLRVIQIPIASKKKCQQINIQHYKNKLTTRMFCAGYEKGGVDACQGDSGSAAVVNLKLYGLVSFGYQCGLPSLYGVYANVAQVRSWIEDTVTFKV